MRPMFRPLLLMIALVSSTLLAGCAVPPPGNDPEAIAEFKENNDPLEPANRFFYQVNDALDTVLMKPVATIYRGVVPKPVRSVVHNVLNHIATPVVLINDILQGDKDRAGATISRFIVNSTLGLGGVFDMASDLSIPRHDADFGMTLAVWGAPEGAYLFLPILGPSNPRDGIGFAVDTFGLDPLGWVGRGAAVHDLRRARTGISAVDARAEYLDAFDEVKAQALDPYATVRSLTRQYRAARIGEAKRDETGAVKKSP